MRHVFRKKEKEQNERNIFSSFVKSILTVLVTKRKFAKNILRLNLLEVA